MQASPKPALQPAAPQAAAVHPHTSPVEKQPEALPREGLVLVDSVNACMELCELWQQKSSWAFALDYTAGDIRASKQLEMPRVGPASASGQFLSLLGILISCNHNT